MKQIQSIKNCPICGRSPVFESHDMGRDNGHGYPGCTSMDFFCAHCGVPEKSGACDVHMPKEDVFPTAVEKWNREVDRLQAFLDEKKAKETD